MSELFGAALQAIFSVMHASSTSALRAARGYDGRPVGWVTVAASSMAAAVYAPMTVGSFFGVAAVREVLESDFLWFIGLLMLIPAVLMVAMALAAIGFGITIGAWLLVDRPGARWFGAAHALGAMVIAMFVLSMQTWVATVVGWSTVGLAGALLILVLIPRTELRATPTIAPAATPELTSPTPRTRRRRFVL